MQGAKFIIEIEARIGDEPTTVKVTDLSTAQNQWASHYVLRGESQLEIHVNRDGLETLSFVPHGAG